VPSSNLEVIRANSGAFSRRDVAAMLAFYAPDAVVTDRRAVGWGEFRGHDALRSYYQGLFDNAAAMREELEVVSEEGDLVIASCRLVARIAGHDDAGEMSFDYALRIRMAGGLIASIDIYDDTEAASAV
jgi:ketosteroid isomerase-like protein